MDRGHSRAEIRYYTFAQLRRATQAAERARRRELRDMTVAIRAASKYQSRDFRAFVRKLDEQ